MEAQEPARSVDWRMLLVRAAELEHFKRRYPDLSAASILEAISQHGLHRMALEAALRH